MSIKYNEFGEVISVNGLTTGQHLGTPMQDAIGTEEENSAYGTELQTVTRVSNCVEDKQPNTCGQLSEDKPFEVEEKKILLAEGVTEYGTYYFNQGLQIKVGEKYTFVIDGVEYTGVGEFESPDHYVLLVDAQGDDVGCVYDNDINLFDAAGTYHKIELLLERTYRTHHDFMVLVNVITTDDDHSFDAKVVAGDFATAKEKISKGLPVTCYCCIDVKDPGRQMKYNGVSEVMYLIDNDGLEYMYVDCIMCTFNIFPDNTVEED